MEDRHRRCHQIITSFVVLLVKLAHHSAASSHLTHYDPLISSSSFGEPIFRLEPPSVINFANTQGATIVCLASGSPKPTVSWFSSSSFNSDIIGHSTSLRLDEFQSVSNVSGLRQILYNGNVLRLSPFAEADFRQDIHSTEYRCVAANQLTTIHSRSVLVQAGE